MLWYIIEFSFTYKLICFGPEYRQIFFIIYIKQHQVEILDFLLCHSWHLLKRFAHNNDTQDTSFLFILDLSSKIRLNAFIQYFSPYSEAFCRCKDIGYRPALSIVQFISLYIAIIVYGHSVLNRQFFLQHNTIKGS